jgi:hypothetical protein
LEAFYHEGFERDFMIYAGFVDIFFFDRSVRFDLFIRQKANKSKSKFPSMLPVQWFAF